MTIDSNTGNNLIFNEQKINENYNELDVKLTEMMTKVNRLLEETCAFKNYLESPPIEEKKL